MSIKYNNLKKTVVRNDVQRRDVMNCDPDVSVVTDCHAHPAYSTCRATFQIDAFVEYAHSVLCVSCDSYGKNIAVVSYIKSRLNTLCVHHEGLWEVEVLH